MNSESVMLKCSIVRGGTSKAIFIMKNELPADPVLRDKVILAIYGSPDLRQIDGLGGADLLTSKLAIIAPPSAPGADVDYTFGQVSTAEAFVDYGGNCGNISSAVGPFAIDKGLVTPVEPFTTVKIHLTNSGQMLTAVVPVKDGKSAVEGDFAIDGVPGTGAKISLDWSDVVGGVTGKLLPTGNVKDVIEADGAKYTVSVVDAGNPVVFVRAEELGMKGTETPAQIDGNKELSARIEKVRGLVCERLGTVKSWQEARTVTPYQPFVAIISKPVSYDCFNGKHVEGRDIDIVSRLTSMLMINKTYPGTGTVCTGAAARVKGSIVWDLLSEQAKARSILYIGHPSGIIPVEAVASYQGQQTVLEKLNIYRTARILMDGYVYVRKSVIGK